MQMIEVDVFYPDVHGSREFITLNLFNFLCISSTFLLLRVRCCYYNITVYLYRAAQVYRCMCPIRCIDLLSTDRQDHQRFSVKYATLMIITNIWIITVQVPSNYSATKRIIKNKIMADST